MRTVTDSAALARRALLENHLAFTSAHRGTVLRTPESIRIESELPGFRCLLPLAAADAPSLRPQLGRASLVRLPPWSECTPADLAPLGFAPAGALVYMLLARSLPEAAPPASLHLEEVRDAQALERFTEVQVAGFLEGEPPDEVGRWRRWLGEANRRNLGAAGQSFLLARVRGEPAGVLLILRDGATAGIYAVATAPSFRRRGISRALLAHAIRGVAADGDTPVTLQVLQGSLAERIYLALGFVTAFVSPQFARVEPA